MSENRNTFLRWFEARARPIRGARYERFGGVLAIVADSLADAVRQSIHIWLGAGDVPVDAIPYLFQSAGIPPYRNDLDTPVGYAHALARLASKWISHRRSGTPTGIIAELFSAGFPGAEVGIPNPDEARFVVGLAGATAPIDWGDGTWGEFVWGTDGITLEEARLAWDVVRYWQPARSRFEGFVPT